MKTMLVGKRVYQMEDKKAEQVLNLASEQVGTGIYALEKDNLIELMNEKGTKSQTKQARRYYRKQGYKVYACGL